MVTLLHVFYIQELLGIIELKCNSKVHCMQKIFKTKTFLFNTQTVVCYRYVMEMFIQFAPIKNCIYTG